MPECDIYIEDSRMSRSHANLVPMDDGLRIQDLDSTNGTFINDLRVGKGIAFDGDEVRFDCVRFLVEGNNLRDDSKQSVTNDAGRRARQPRALWWALLLVAAAAVAAAWFVIATS
jgi:pSer/pThr/pTyr-binding forkhead associated (FHA) protein